MRSIEGNNCILFFLFFCQPEGIAFINKNFDRWSSSSVPRCWLCLSSRLSCQSLLWVRILFPSRFCMTATLLAPVPWELPWRWSRVAYYVGAQSRRCGNLDIDVSFLNNTRAVCKISIFFFRRYFTYVRDYSLKAPGSFSSSKFSFISNFTHTTTLSWKLIPTHRLLLGVK